VLVVGGGELAAPAALAPKQQNKFQHKNQDLKHQEYIHINDIGMLILIINL
jgi:hypothetical protein